VAHAIIAFYIAIEFVSLWLAATSLLFYRSERAKGYLYGALLLGSVAMMFLCEIILAYCNANGIVLRTGFFWLIEAFHGACQLLHVFSIVRLAVSVVRLRMPPYINAIHLASIMVFGGLIALLLLRRNFFQIELIVFGIAHGVSLGIVIWFRSRILSQTLRRAAVQFAAIGLFFAPTTGLSVYTGLADYLPFGRITLQIAYLLIAEILTGYYAVKLLFAKRPAAEPIQHPEQFRRLLSGRELDVVCMVKNGYTNKEIAELLHISPRTVTNHLYNIYRKVNVRNRVELVNQVAVTD
jgi:DNA-binding CsgD family transcriptional regulator